MRRLGVWLSGLVIMAIAVAPVIAETKNGKTADEGATIGTGAKARTVGTPASPTPEPVASPAGTVDAVKVDVLLNALLKKGVFTPAEINAIRVAAPDSELKLLIEALTRKGILNTTDLSAAPPPADPPAPVPSRQQDVAPQTAAETKLAVPTVIPAVVPLRVLAFDPPQSGGLVGVKVGLVTFSPYGFIKATAEQDSSSPNGDDFPIPGGLMLLPGSNTGPNADPEFHVKARQSRVGIALEWPTISRSLSSPAAFEADFEGNFNESDNADVTSIRNPNLRLRLAYVRADYSASERTSLFFVGGQDWTLFGSKALPNMLDTTWNAADYGAIYNRSPQFRFGAVQKLGSSSRNFKLSPEFAIMMPSSGQVERLTFCSLANVYCPAGGSPSDGFMSQVGEAERQGADSDKPELNAGLTVQFRLDKAPLVAPAQIFWTGMFGRRSSIVPNTAEDLLGDEYPTALVAGTPLAKGYTAGSDMYGNQVATQLPTRWFTLVVSGYRGCRYARGVGRATYDQLHRYNQTLPNSPCQREWRYSGTLLSGYGLR